MSVLRISLFGKMQLSAGDNELSALERGKVHELFCYLLIHRNRHHPRELLASLLWGDCSTAHSKKKLRHVLWQLHSALQELDPNLAVILNADANWVALDASRFLELDVATFEDAYEAMQKCKSQALAPELVQKLQTAVELYRGDLLDGLYQDWCLFERERLQVMYLAMLSKLLSYCEGQALYAEALAYGITILRYDNTNERTYRDLMRLQYLSGDRTGALRQYERCVAVLARELEIKPSQGTVDLYKQIKNDAYCNSADPKGPAEAQRQSGNENVMVLIRHIREAQAMLAQLHAKLEQDIRAIEAILQE